MIKKLLPIFILLISQTILAQNFTVSDLQSVKERLIKNKNSIVPQAESTPTYVPIQIHITGTDDGNDRANPSDVMDMFCYLNDFFLAYDIQFYLHDGFNYMDNTVLHNHNSNNHSNIQFSNYRVDNVINIYIVKAMGNSQLFLKYDPSTGRDWIVVRRDKVTDLPPIFLLKGLGSYFSLLPNYWCWNFSPVFNSTNDSILCYNGVLEPIELQNGSNCDVAGDLICDTPPDYFFGTTWLDCVFTDTILDPNGEMVHPMEDNAMSSFNNCTAYQFTPEQVGVIQTDIQNRSNTTVSWQTLNIDTSFVPLEVTALPGIISPTNGEVTTYSNLVDFVWEEVPNANSYLFEIDQVNEYNDHPQAFVLNNNTITLSNLNEDTQYYWRVTPFSKGSYCNLLTTESSTFTTGLSVGINNVLKASELDASVIPNLFQTSFSLNIFLEKNEILNIELYDLSGKKRKEIANQEYTSGEHQVLIEANELSDGVYLVRIQAESGVKTLRVVKQ